MHQRLPKPVSSPIALFISKRAMTKRYWLAWKRVFGMAGWDWLSARLLVFLCPYPGASNLPLKLQGRWVSRFADGVVRPMPLTSGNPQRL